MHLGLEVLSNSGGCFLCLSVAGRRVLTVNGDLTESAVFECELVDLQVLDHGLRVFVFVEQNGFLRVVNSDVLHLVYQKLLHDQIDHAI